MNAPYLKFKSFSQKSTNNKNQNVLSLRYYVRRFFFDSLYYILIF